MTGAKAASIRGGYAAVLLGTARTRGPSLPGETPCRRSGGPSATTGDTSDVSRSEVNAGGEPG